MGICNAAQEKGYHIILLSLRVGELQPLKSILTQGKTDGVILMRTWVTDVTIEYLSAQSIPLLCWGIHRIVQFSVWIMIQFVHARK